MVGVVSLWSTCSVVGNGVEMLKTGLLAVTTEELSWHHASGNVVPSGAVVQLLWSFQMQDGVTRWAVSWGGSVIHSIPESLLRA